MPMITDEARARASFPAPALTALLAIIMAMSIMLTLARMYTRYTIHQRIWWDDWTMVAACLGTIALCGIQLNMISYGNGVNFEDVPPEARRVFMNLFLDTQMVARTAIFFARLTCVNQSLVFILASVINILTDVAVLLIPIRSIWKLEMSRRRKWAVCALFMFGALAPIASMGNSPNKTAVYAVIALLATAEQGVAMVIGSAPVCRSLALRVTRGGRTFSPEGNASVAQRMWPSREWRRPRDPFCITTDDGTTG
ncbi:GPCR, PTH11-type, partial [Metarhizium majus ARSEF 297]